MPLTIKECIKHYAKKLKNVTDIPQKEVELCILNILDKSRVWLHLNYDVEFTQANKLEQMIEKRATSYPLEYILGSAGFYGEEFLVEEGVLIPRPETEILVDKAYEILKTIKNPKVVEIGVGSGIISIMLAKMIPDIEIVAVDINPKALKLAQKNANKFDVEDKIKFISSNLLEKVTGSFNMCISNPPYIANDYKLPLNVEHEPKNALFGGRVGDELLKKIIYQTHKRKIKYLLCEMGYDQKESLLRYLKDFSKIDIQFYKDYSGFDRGFITTLTK